VLEVILLFDTILVTGDCGFIGSCFVLQQKGWQPEAVIAVCLDGQQLSAAVSCSCQGDAS